MSNVLQGVYGIGIMESGRAGYVENNMSLPCSSVSRAYELLEEADKMLSCLKEFQDEISVTIKDLEALKMSDEEYESASRINQALSDLLDKTGDVYTEANYIYGKYHNNHIADFGRMV